jgi:hypothetical protein
MRSHLHTQSSISDLLSGTAALLFGSWQVVLISTLCFALCAAVLKTLPDRRMQQREDTLALSLNLRWDELRSRVEDDMQQLLVASPEEIVREMESLTLFPAVDASPHISLVYFLNIVPYILVMVAIVLSMFFISTSYYFLFFSPVASTPLRALSRLPVFIARLLTLSLLVMASSLVWVPFIGVGLAAYMLPRLSLSPAYLATGNKHSLSALKESWILTRGRWLRMIVRLIVLILVGLVFLWMCSIPVSIAALFLPRLAALLWLAVLALLSAYIAAGMTVLAR